MVRFVSEKLGKAERQQYLDLDRDFANHGKNATSPFCTHCLAIGRALDDHTIVIDYYLNEIVSMRNGMSRYSASNGEVINTCFDLLVYLADQPERSSIVKSRHLGTYGLRAGWSGTVNADKLSYC